MEQVRIGSRMQKPSVQFQKNLQHMEELFETFLAVTLKSGVIAVSSLLDIFKGKNVDVPEDIISYFLCAGFISERKY